MKNQKNITITEYCSFVRINGIENDKYKSLPEKTFDELEKFILSSKNEDVLNIMNISIKKGMGKVITAKKYIGVIMLKDGTTIEILPKIYPSTDITVVKRLVLDMLKTLNNSPYKYLNMANIDIEKMNIFEFFIHMFIEQVLFITKRGLKCDYEEVKSNETFFKGKIQFKEHIKYNYIHKERCYVQHDEFNINRVENRILKATLIYLYRKTKSSKNKNDIKILLNSFDSVDVSTNYENDFSKVKKDINTKDYTIALLWCKIFLRNKSFTSFAGSDVAFALLFPMETLFESYIANQLKSVLDTTKYNISIQDKSYYLFEEPKKSFEIRPDIVIENKNNKKIFIMDTKWKILSDEYRNYGISQNDMYQMYTYQKKYMAENVTLIYPYTDKVLKDKPIEFNSKSKDGNDVKIKVRFIDLSKKVQDELKTLLEEIY